MHARFPAVRILSLVLFALLCAIVAYWALLLLAPRSPIAPAGAVSKSQAPIDLARTSGLFGGAVASGPVVAPPVNIQVVGVVAAGEQGVALLAVEGNPAKPFYVGQQIVDGIKLTAVEPGSVQLDSRGIALNLPAPERASVTVLTSGTNRPAGQAGPATAPPVNLASPPAGAASARRAPTMQPGAQPLPSMPAQPGTVPPMAARPAIPPGMPPGMPPGFTMPTGSPFTAGQPALQEAPGVPDTDPVPGVVPSDVTSAPPVDAEGQSGVPMEVNPVDTGAPASQVADPGLTVGG